MNLVYVYNNHLKAHGYLHFSFTKVFINEHFLYTSYKQIILYYLQLVMLIIIGYPMAIMKCFT